MNINNHQSITIDLRKTKSITTPVFIQQDKNIVDITVLDNGIAADLISNVVEVVVNLKRPDGVIYTHLVPFSGNIVTYEMSSDDMLISGICEVEIQFHSADILNERLSTKRFKIHLLEQIGSVIVSEVTPEVTVLRELIDEVNTSSEFQINAAKILGISAMDSRFGVKGNANYFNSSTGKWYEDSLYLVESSDDTTALVAVHDYANANKYPVFYPPLNFYLKDPSSIIKIKQNVNFGQGKFIIDEAFGSTSKPRFRIESYDDFSGVAYQTLDLTQFNLPTLIGKINRKTTTISELAAYRNCYVIIEDSTTLTGVRSGSNVSAGTTKVEIFRIEDGGKVVGDISQDFTNITSIKVQTMEDSWLTVEGGKFYLTGTSNTALLSDDYPYSGFSIRRCRTLFKNQYVGLYGTNQDVQLEANNGFYNASSVSDVTFDTIRLFPRINETIGGTPQGTYGMGFSKCMNITMRNVGAEGDNLHWGLYAPNNIKNLLIDNCDINRVDTHYWCWNMDIQNSNIGMKGVSMTGGGRLNIENSTIMGNQLVDFRQDYGAFWDGDIHIENVTLFPFDAATEIHLLQFDQVDYNYNIRTPLGRSIIIRDITVDFRYITAAFTPKSFIFYMPTFGQKVNGGYRTEFPNEIIVENIRAVGTYRKGFILGNLPKPQDMEVYDKVSGSIDSNGVITTNSVIQFRNIDCYDFGAVNSTETSRSNMSFIINVADTITYQSNGVIPDVLIENCGKIFASFKASLANVVIRNCIVNCYDNLESNGRTKVLYDNCLFQPNVTTNQRVYYTYGRQTFFNSCTFDSPKLNGVVDGTIDYGIISWNTFVRGNMSNCRCTESYYALKAPVDRDFMNMIANGTIQRDSEGDYRAYNKPKGISSTISLNAGIQSDFIITYPVGLFASAPILKYSIYNTDIEGQYTTAHSIIANSGTGATIRLKNKGATSQNYLVYWEAVQP